MTPIDTQRLHDIAAIRDEDIDTSDIPELSDAFFASAVVIRPGQLLPLTEVEQRLKDLGVGHFAVDELIRAARKNRAKIALCTPDEPSAAPTDRQDGDNQ